eukprot:gene16767-19935_t
MVKPENPIGAALIWRNILTLALTLAVFLSLVTIVIVIVRLFKKHDQNKLKISLRAKAEIYLAYTHIGEFIEFVQVFFSLVSVVLFIYGTYLDEHLAPPNWFLFIEVSLIVFFIAHWFLDLFVTKDKLHFLFSFFSLIDLITILPIIIDIAKGDFPFILSTFQFLRVLRVIRVLRLSRVLHYFKNEVTKYTFKAFIVVFTFIMVLAGFYMNIETNGGEPLQFHTTVYFLVVTLATVGYGDIYPTTALGQITITLALTIGAGVLIPYHISKLMEKLQQDSRHVFFCGDFSLTHLMDFLAEFYHERHGRLKKEVVLMCPNPPDDKFKALLLHPFYKHRLIYLQGSPLFEQDLARTKLSKADACFISLPPSWEDGDTDNILCAYAVKSMNKNIKIFSHLVTSKNTNKAPFLKGAMCMEEFRSAMLAQSIICPGYNVFFSNLFTSRNIPSIVPVRWLSEYYFLVGEALVDVILSIYFGNGSLLIGLFIPKEGESGRGKFFLNPPKTTIVTKDMSLVLISHTIYKTKDMSSAVPQRSMFSEGYTKGVADLGKKVSSFLNRLTVPDLELLINDATATESHEQIINESLKTFIGATSKPLAFLPRQASMVRLDTQDHISEELDNEGIFDQREYEEEELTPEDHVKNLCMSEYDGDWIALLSDISVQKTKNANIEKIQERIKFIIDKHSLLTFTLHGKYDTKDGAKEMKGHLLIVCKVLKGLDLLLHHLRLPYTTSVMTNAHLKTGVQPIVVLYKDDPPEESWFDQMRALPLIAFIKGSASNHSDLDKCGARNADTIIITSNPYDEIDKNHIDSFTLMSYVDIMKCNNRAKIITELLHEPNIRFLEDKKLKCAGSNKRFQSYLQANQDNTFAKPEFFSCPHFSSGRVTTYTVLDSLVVQAHYHEAITDVANELAFGVNGLYKSHHTLGLNKTITNEESRCFSRLLKLPPIYHGRTYGELLKGFLQQKNMLVLGLQRSKEPMGAPVPYVFTCPHPTTILHENDHIYVFSDTPISN